MNENKTKNIKIAEHVQGAIIDRLLAS